MMEEVDDAELVVERIAALDLGKGRSGGMCASAEPPRARQADAGLRGYGTTTAQLVGDGAWLRIGACSGSDGIHQQPTGRGCITCSRPRVECWLVNAAR